MIVTRALVGPVTQSVAETWVMFGAEGIAVVEGVGVKDGTGVTLGVAGAGGRVGSGGAEAAGTTAEATMWLAGTAVGTGGFWEPGSAAGRQAASNRLPANSHIKPCFFEESHIEVQL